MLSKVLDYRNSLPWLQVLSLFLRHLSGMPKVHFVGAIPALSSTKSEKISLFLIGAIPALVNAVTATQINEARGGERRTITIDLRRGHNYIGSQPYWDYNEYTEILQVEQVPGIEAL